MLALQEAWQRLRRCLWRKDAVVAGQGHRGYGAGKRRILEGRGAGEEDLGAWAKYGASSDGHI